ncbi:MAG: Xaa-Pro peptidase family protein [Bacillota bacterium]
MNGFEKEIKNRITKLQDKLKVLELDGALILERANLYYFSGTGQNCYLFIPSCGEPILMVKRDLDRALLESPLKNIVPIRSRKEIISILEDCGVCPITSIGMELDVIPVNWYLYFTKIFKGSIVSDISLTIRDVRMIKSSYEISLIRESGVKHSELFKYASKAIKKGMSDQELAGLIEGYARKLGHIGYTRFRGFNVEFFMGHTLVGSPGAVRGPYDVMPAGGKGIHPLFPQGISGAVIKEGDPVCIDYVGNYTGYMVDQTRTFFVGRKAKVLDKAMGVVAEIQQMIEESMRSGVNGRNLYDNSLAMAVKSGFEEFFMGYPRGVPFIGHGIGMEINEWPVIARGYDIELQAGMVIAIEPKFVFPDLGMVGTEDTYLIKEGGLEKLTLD